MSRVSRLILIAAALMPLLSRPSPAADAVPERERLLEKMRSINRWGPQAPVVANTAAQVDKAIGLGEDAEFRIGWGLTKDEKAYRFWWVDGKFTWEFLTPDAAAAKGFKRMDVSFTETPKRGAPAVDAAAGAPSLLGTTWVGETLDTHERLSLGFEPNGVLDFFSHGADGRRNGTWSQEGPVVHLDMNKGYVRYDGTITGDRMEGGAQNKLAHQWRWTATRQPGAGAPAASAPAPGGLVGTTWSGIVLDRPMTFRFEDGSVLVYGKKSTWSRNGDSIHLELNNGYAKYDGTITGDRMQGGAQNKVGKQWSWSVTRDGAPAAAAEAAPSAAIAPPSVVAKPRPLSKDEARTLDDQLAP